MAVTPFFIYFPTPAETFQDFKAEVMGGSKPYLTSTMDCCASASTSSDHLAGLDIAFEDEFNVLPSCTVDGYTIY